MYSRVHVFVIEFFYLDQVRTSDENGSIGEEDQTLREGERNAVDMGLLQVLPE